MRTGKDADVQDETPHIRFIHDFRSFLGLSLDESDIYNNRVHIFSGLCLRSSLFFE